MNTTPRSNDRLLALAWPETGLAEAMHLLADRAGLQPRVDDASRWRPPGGADALTLSNWVQRSADAIGVEAEPITCRYSETAATLRGLGPGLVKLSGESTMYLAVLAGRGKRLTVLAPGGGVIRVGVDQVRRLLTQATEEKAAPTVAGVLKHVAPRRQAQARDALCCELLDGHPVRVGWLLRPAAHAPLPQHAGALELPIWLTALTAAHLSAAAFWILGWWLLGWAALSGRPDGGWSMGSPLRTHAGALRLLHPVLYSVVIGERRGELDALRPRRPRIPGHE